MLKVLKSSAQKHQNLDIRYCIWYVAFCNGCLTVFFGECPLSLKRIVIKGKSCKSIFAATKRPKLKLCLFCCPKDI